MHCWVRFVLIFCCLLLTNLSFGQEGTPLSTNFSFGESSIDNESWAMAQDENGQMLFANRRGIVTFDGIKWTTISTPSIPLALHYDPQTSRVFVGCRNNIGFLNKLKNGTYEYVSLNGGRKNFGSIQRIASIEGYVLFYSDDMLTRFSLKEKNKEINLKENEYFVNKYDDYSKLDWKETIKSFHLPDEEMNKNLENFTNQVIN